MINYDTQHQKQLYYKFPIQEGNFYLFNSNIDYYLSKNYDEENRIYMTWTCHKRQMNIRHSYYFFKKVIPKKTCNQIIKKFSKLKLVKGTTKGNVEKIRDSKIIFTSEPFLYDLINPYIHAANENSGWNFEWDHTEPLQFTKYALNEHYNWHTDAAPEP